MVLRVMQQLIPSFCSKVRRRCAISLERDAKGFERVDSPDGVQVSACPCKEAFTFAILEVLECEERQRLLPPPVAPQRQPGKLCCIQ